MYYAYNMSKVYSEAWGEGSLQLPSGGVRASGQVRRDMAAGSFARGFNLASWREGCWAYLGMNYNSGAFYLYNRGHQGFQHVLEHP